MTSQAESQKVRSTAWTGLTFTTHTTEQNRLALRVTDGQPGTARLVITDNVAYSDVRLFLKLFKNRFL